jgi:predicted transposase YdaD
VNEMKNNCICKETRKEGRKKGRKEGRKEGRREGMKEERKPSFLLKMDSFSQ